MRRPQRRGGGASPGRFLRAAAAAAVACGLMTMAPGGAAEARAAGSADSGWTRTWGTAMGTAGDPDETKVSGRQTLRMVVHTSIGGGTARIHLVNTFSKSPVTIGHATVARQSAGATAAGKPVTLTFGGSERTVLAPGGSVYSDAAAFPVRSDENLLVSIYLPEAVTSAPYHEYTRQTSYVSAPGDGADRAGETGGGSFGRHPYWSFLAGVDVTAAESRGTVVAIGDSQTDGGWSTPDTNRRWPDAYARALRAQGRPMGVVNAGISANRLLADHSTKPSIKPVYGPSALSRFDRDVLAQPNVKSVVLYEGINDIALDDANSTDLIAGIRQLAERSHQAGLTFTVATIPPFKGANDYYTEAREQVRRQVNAYIRSTRDVDAVADFDAATRDPLDPAKLFAAYHGTGDRDDALHFNDNGCQALADALAGGDTPVRFTPNFSQTTAADFTGDGVADIVARGTEDLYLWPGAGDGTFRRPVQLKARWNYTEAAAGDFTGDGKADLVARDANADLYLWEGTGNGTLGEPRRLTGGWNFTETTAGDFTGDGITDLIARDAKGDLSMWDGRPGGDFTRPHLVEAGWTYTQATAGDFTGDGKPDLIARDAKADLYLWEGKANGDFTTRRLLTGDWTYSETAAGTFYGGGTSHLIARSEANGVLREWVNRGGGDFSRPLRLTDGW
ncbi:FG-GAP-like repeat-containing protein [Streptomyces sp. SCA3-4]|uniref:FG-GAP-like repeat-containing protein n=1 Tax=Streptomyces sichuanensis TaxID=2871810 RepID=UPI001CE2FDBB|nr:FG-GAP-like repeat-containing protein [Streptomyces sichuanensis]MCA6096395.1 FG-GAP-like repeat-containing protein [Streptomyces sichuanensis]